MTQGIIGGATDYSCQSPQQILEDIINWIEYTKEIEFKMSEWLQSVQNTTRWGLVPFNFKMTINTTITYCNTIINDLNIVKNSIENNCITKREVKLLSKIGDMAKEYNYNYGSDYHEDEIHWHQYGDTVFSIIEKMYAEGRDFFVTLQDASNAESRMEDYMQTGNVMNVNIGGDVSSSQIQVGTVNSSQNMAKDITEFPYDEVQNILYELTKYKEQISIEFKENGKKFCEALDEAVEETKKKGNPDKIKKLSNIMKEAAARVSTGLIVEGVKSLITRLPF